MHHTPTYISRTQTVITAPVIRLQQRSSSAINNSSSLLLGAMHPLFFCSKISCSWSKSLRKFVRYTYYARWTIPRGSCRPCYERDLPLVCDCVREFSIVVWLLSGKCLTLTVHCPFIACSWSVNNCLFISKRWSADQLQFSK